MKSFYDAAKELKQKSSQKLKESQLKISQRVKELNKPNFILTNSEKWK